MKLRLYAVIVFVIFLFGFSAFNPVTLRQPSDFHLVKVNHQGEELAIWSGPWHCVFDQNTGLLWERKQDDETIHDGYWTYSWFQNGQGVPNYGDCYFEDERCDVDDLIRKANQNKTCGVDDWRLPTSAELMTIVSDQLRPGEPTINKDFFPQTKKGDYWTAEGGKPLTGVYAHLKRGAIAINFGQGEMVTLPYRNAAFVRLVSNRHSHSIDRPAE